MAVTGFFIALSYACNARRQILGQLRHLRFLAIATDNLKRA
jgi:hypothetical protein